MRILLVSPNLWDMICFRIDLIRELRAQGHEVEIHCGSFDPQSADALTALGAKLSVAPSEALVGPHLLTTLRRSPPDALIAYTHRRIAIAAPLAAHAGVPRIVGVVTGLGRGRQSPLSLRGQLERTLFDRALRFGLRSCHATVVLNADDREELKERGLAPPPPISLVPSEGVNVHRFASPHRQPPPPGHARFLLVGRLLVSKGVPTFLEAARLVGAQCPTARFELVGPAAPRHPDRLSTETMRALTSDRTVQWRGLRTDMPEVYAGADVFVLPSVAEGRSMAMLEAMAAGLPVLTTRAPGCRDTITDGVHGLLAPAEDPHALADNMLALLRDPGRAHRMGQRAHQHVLEHHDASVILPQLLERLLGGRNIESPGRTG